MTMLALAQYGVGALVNTAVHPFCFVKVLIQAGYEPIDPKPSSTLLGKHFLIYPNVFQYMSYIKKVDGFGGLYRGFLSRALCAFIGNIVQQNVALAISRGTEDRSDILSNIDKYDGFPIDLDRDKKTSDENDDLTLWLINFVRKTSMETVSLCCGIIASHPFHVITMRCMIQFVGRETLYDSIYSSFREILDNEGFLGFFAGLCPRLIREIFTLWTVNLISNLIGKFQFEQDSIVKFVIASTGCVTSHFAYPLTLTCNIMAMNGSGLKASSLPRMQKYDNWFECFCSLQGDGQLMRGSSMFRRHCFKH